MILNINIPKKVLFSTTMTFKMNELKRWRPQMVIDMGRLKQDEPIVLHNFEMINGKLVKVR